MTDLLRTGAQQLIATAIEVEFVGYLAQFSELRTEAAGLSANTVLRLNCDWAKAYYGWRDAAFDDEPIVYMWADGIHSGKRGEDDKLCDLVIIVVTVRDKKWFLAIEHGVHEPNQSWREVLLSLKS